MPRRRRMGVGCSVTAVRDMGSFRLASIVVLVAATLVLGFVLIAVSSEQGSAATWPKNVRGYVEDSAGTRIEGANVTVEMWNGITLRKTLYCDATDSDGFYQVTFAMGDWDEGNTIEVTARLGIDSATNSTTADALPMQYIDVTLGIVIPEFGALLGSPLTFVSIGLAAIVILSFRARKRTPLAPG